MAGTVADRDADRAASSTTALLTGASHRGRTLVVDRRRHRRRLRGRPTALRRIGLRHQRHHGLVVVGEIVLDLGRLVAGALLGLLDQAVEPLGGGGELLRREGALLLGGGGIPKEDR